MVNTNLEGPFVLTTTKVDSAITEISPGAYALGYLKDDGVFVVQYVGRSDDNLNSRLHDWVGKYRHFKASYFNLSKEAFERECKIYHDFGEKESLNNSIHPDRPSGTYWECPICDIFD